MIVKWKQEFLSRAASVFEKPQTLNPEEQVDTHHLYVKIGRLGLENKFLKKA